jgi:hypothetical protein
MVFECQTGRTRPSNIEIDMFLLPLTIFQSDRLNRKYHLLDL